MSRLARNNEMVERVSQAIIDMMFAAHEQPLADDLVNKYRATARSAIRAMRDPTDAMCEAAGWHDQSDVNQYQRAIDEALK